MKIAKMMAPSKGVTNTFIAGDWHTSTLNLKTYNIMKKHALSLPPEMRNLIINGDFLDAADVMPRNPMYKKWIGRGDGMDEFFIPSAKAEFDWGNEILDDIQTVFNDVIFLYGNHDWRYDDFMRKVPADYAHHFDLKKNLSLASRKIDYVGYNEWLDWGDKLAITHGMYHGTTCHKKHYEVSGGKNVIFSHIHYRGCKSFIVRGNSIHSWSLPAMCDLNPDYIKGRETNWSNGYGQILMRPDSDFNFYTHSVVNGELTLPSGLILRG